LHIRGTLDLPATNHEIFQFFDIADRTAYRLLRNGDRRGFHEESWKETRGRKCIITPKQLDEIEALLNHEDREIAFEARSQPWEQLGHVIGLEASGKTIRRTMQSRGCKKYILETDFTSTECKSSH
jgi:transposase